MLKVGLSLVTIGKFWAQIRLEGTFQRLSFIPAQIIKAWAWFGLEKMGSFHFYVRRNSKLIFKRLSNSSSSQIFVKFRIKFSILDIYIYIMIMNYFECQSISISKRHLHKKRQYRIFILKNEVPRQSKEETWLTVFTLTTSQVHIPLAKSCVHHCLNRHFQNKI